MFDVESGSSEALALEPSGGPLLLVDQEVGSRTALQRGLAKCGFEVAAVASGRAALAAAAEWSFGFAVAEMRLGDGSGLALVEQLLEHNNSMRIVVVTAFDSFASVVIALRAGAVDYLSKPTGPDAVANALLGRGTTLVTVPESPLGINRVCWEHIQRVFEQCGRNVTRRALQLRMHRRTLQRMLGKRAPNPRAQAPGPTEISVSRFRRQHAGNRMRHECSGCRWHNRPGAVRHQQKGPTQRTSRRRSLSRSRLVRLTNVNAS
jgi:two-component system response regulator RegA